MYQKRLFLYAAAAVMFVFAATAFGVQDSALEDIKYKEDYDRIQKIIKITDVVKRGEQIVALYQERPDMDQKLREYIDNIFTRDLDTMLTQRKVVALRALTERTVKVRPKFGEVYLYQGAAYKNDNKLQEAIDAFAKCYVINNPLKNRAKQQLDLAYRALHKGSLVGQDKVISKAAKELQ